MTRLPRVFIKSRAARPFFARHPWVFANSIAKVEGSPQPGDEVDVVTHDDQPIARGLFNPHSGIRVRLYRWDDGAIDDAFFLSKIEAAVRWRVDGLKLGGPGGAYRVVFSESDGLSGLTVDRYDRHLVVQFGGLGLYRKREAILKSLALAMPDIETVVIKGDHSSSAAEGLKVEEGPVGGSTGGLEATIVDNGITYAVDLGSTQKTGFYLDQRDNRRAVAGYAVGRRVLDLYCHSGGFSLNALLRGGAASTLGFDSSGPAIDLARKNAVANHASAARFEEADVPKALERLGESNERFGLIVCDPPKFVRDPKGLERGVKAYLRLNRAAVDLLEPNGILATCSCSGSVDRELFIQVVAQVGEVTGRSIQILESRGQAPDHPVAASCLETEYLKCLICRVE